MNFNIFYLAFGCCQNPPSLAGGGQNRCPLLEALLGLNGGFFSGRFLTYRLGQKIHRGHLGGWKCYWGAEKIAPNVLNLRTQVSSSVQTNAAPYHHRPPPNGSYSMMLLSVYHSPGRLHTLTCWSQVQTWNLDSSVKRIYPREGKYQRCMISFATLAFQPTPDGNTGSIVFFFVVPHKSLIRNICLWCKITMAFKSIVSILMYFNFKMRLNILLHNAFSSALCYYTAELLPTCGHPPTIVRPSVHKTGFLRTCPAD